MLNFLLPMTRLWPSLFGTVQVVEWRRSCGGIEQDSRAVGVGNLQVFFGPSNFATDRRLSQHLHTFAVQGVIDQLRTEWSLLALVCTENLVRIELVMESRHACGDDRADLSGPQRAGGNRQAGRGRSTAGPSHYRTRDIHIFSSVKR
jgi:hypothetical protein